MKAPVAGRFAPGEGRARPSFTPKTLQCPQCGGSLSVKDERSELVVCPYCGHHLDAGQEVLTVLGKGPDRAWSFPLDLGDSYRYRGKRYEVIARLAYIEDGDIGCCTRDYYLYNPYQGTFWLSEYQGQWSMSRTSHVMPKSWPFGRSRGDAIDTHDGHSWAFEEEGVYDLRYVDGSLPWRATIGDKVQYAEFSAKAGGPEQFEVQRIKGEIEYGHGQALAVEQVRTATRKRDLPGVEKLPETAGRQRTWYVGTLKGLAAVFLINLALAIGAAFKGSEVLDTRLEAAQLTGEAFTDPFVLSGDDTVIKVKVKAGGLDNEWMTLDLAVVGADDAVLHVFDEDIEYYHGTEGGESWSEGSRSDSTYIQVPKAGTYRLLVHAVSGRGNQESSELAQRGVRVQVFAGAVTPAYLFVSLFLTTLLLIVVAVFYGRWRQGDEEDD